MTKLTFQSIYQTRCFSIIILGTTLKKHIKSLYLHLENKMVGIAQLVRASDCGSEGRRFDPDYSPHFFLIEN